MRFFTAYMFLVAIALLPNPLPAQQGRWITQATDLYPSISPDGTRLIFHSSRLGRPQVFIADTSGRGAHPLTGIQNQITPIWSPDGRFITLVGFPEGHPDIYIVDAHGTSIRRLTTSPGNDIHPHWSADGTRIYFNSDRDPSEPTVARTHDIYSMDLTGRQIVRHTDCKTTCTYPAPSPNGKLLVYRKEVQRPGTDWDLTRSTTDSEIFIADLDGSHERNLTNSAMFDGWPAWSPNGKWIVFASNRGNVPSVGQIYAVRPDGTGLRQLTEGPWSHAQPSFSPDGKKLYVYKLQEGSDFQFGFIAVVEVPADMHQ